MVRHDKRGDDQREPVLKFTRVAVRAVASGVVGVYSSHTEVWRIVRIPTEVLGDYDGEATAIIEDRRVAFVGDVIVVDEGVEGFAAGCSTWSRFYSDDGGTPIDRPSERARAAHEHWNCEHTLFGATPTEGWTQVTSAAELDGQEALELWTLRTGEYADGEYEAIVARYTWDPDTYRLTVLRDKHGPLCEKSR